VIELNLESWRKFVLKNSGKSQKIVSESENEKEIVIKTSNGEKTKDHTYHKNYVKRIGKKVNLYWNIREKYAEESEDNKTYLLIEIEENNYSIELYFRIQTWISSVLIELEKMEEKKKFESKEIYASELSEKIQIEITKIARVIGECEKEYHINRLEILLGDINVEYGYKINQMIEENIKEPYYPYDYGKREDEELEWIRENILKKE
jgi:hypothetical protein